MEVAPAPLLTSSETLTHLLHQEGSDLARATSAVRTDDEGSYIAATIQSGKAIAVSDGSYKDSCSAAACVIEGTKPNLYQITATATTPGFLETQDPYRAELSGLFMTIAIVNDICKYHQINKGEITIACDGLSAIRKA
eukprot:12337175-Ditylum_brightwellii.AAC.1